MAFENRKIVEIVGIRKVWKSYSHSIKDVYYVLGLKNNLLSVFQMGDQRNNVTFTSVECLITNSKTGNVVLKEKRFKNIYKADIMESLGNNLISLSAIAKNNLIWHKRLGHTSLSHLNKLITKGMVLGLLKTGFNKGTAWNICAIKKHVGSSFKPKKGSTSKSLELLHMGLWDPSEFKVEEEKNMCSSLLMIIQVYLDSLSWV